MSNVPHPSDATKRASARTTMPAEICDHYSEVPRALRQHAHALGLSLADVGFIYVLWSYKFFADSPINPAMDTLARELGTSVDTVARHVKRLERLGVLRVDRKGPGKRAPVASYDLDPCWQALAKIVREARPNLRAVRTSADTSVRTSADSVRGSADRASADLRIEVEEGEVEELKERESARASNRFRMHIQLRRDAEHPSVLPWKRDQILARADKEFEHYKLMCEMDAIAEEQDERMARIEAAMDELDDAESDDGDAVDATVVELVHDSDPPQPEPQPVPKLQPAPVALVVAVPEIVHTPRPDRWADRERMRAECRAGVDASLAEWTAGA